MRIGIPLAFVALPMQLHAADPQPAAATQAVRFEVTGAASDKGLVRVSLCGDPKAPFPGGCVHYSGSEPAKRGALVIVTIPRVPAGRYAVQAYHDENGNDRAEIPPEGYAFGNGTPFPPSFDAAAITVGNGITRAPLKLQYLGQAPSAAAQGSGGAAPPVGIARVDPRGKGLHDGLYLPAGSGPSLLALMWSGGAEGGLDAARVKQ